MTQPLVFLAAGGTGGHLFPAFALAEELRRRGCIIELITDLRGDKFHAGFPARTIHRVPSATLPDKAFRTYLRTGSMLTAGLSAALMLIGRSRPHIMIGFGGYPTLPPIMAARMLGVPTLIHEQNAVMGRANRVLMKVVRGIALSFDSTKFVEGKALAKARVTGAPVRTEILDRAEQLYHPPGPGQRCNLLIFGGSQGARFFSEVAPPALRLLPAGMRQRLTVVQQCREEDIAGVRAAYEQAGVNAHLSTFFRDMPARLAGAHLVLSRAGASTVAELAAMGRPSILVPLPHALDNDQLENATRGEAAGGAWCIPQSELTPERLTAELVLLLEAPERLSEAAVRIRRLAKVDAVARLAEFAEELMD